MTRCTRRQIATISAFGFFFLGAIVSGAERPAGAPSTVRDEHVVPLQDASVKVRIWTEAGEPVQNAYVALIPIWRPWGSPIVEAITEKSITTFHVPQGTYFLVAGARALQISSQGPFKFVPGHGATVDAALKPLTELSGIVTDSSGKPLPGVRVAQSRAVIIPPLGSVSEMALQYLSGDWSTVTDQDGRWKLGMPDVKTPLLFSADGYQPAWRIYKKDDKTPLKVRLRLGATLVVNCNRLDSDLTVTLERERPDIADSIPRDWQRLVWARWVSTKAIKWRALPSGTYSIYAKYSNPALMMGSAQKIGSVTLAEGRDIEIDLTLPKRPNAAKSIADFFIQGASPAELVDGLQAFGAAATGRVQRTRSSLQWVIGGSVLHLDTEGLRGLFYATTPDRFIAPDLRSSGGLVSERMPVTATIYNRSDAYAVVRFSDKGLQLPRAGTAVWSGCPQGKQIAVPMDIDTSTAHFVAATGCRSGVLSFVPFEPVLINRPLRAGEQELGEFLLHAAATADVRVVRDPEGTAVADVAVRVLSVDKSAPNGGWIEAGRATSGVDGWAHFDAVPVQRELQFIAQTNAGDTSAAAEGLAEPRGRVVINPLTIPKPATLIVVPKIDESVRSISPGARVMSIIIESADPRRADAEKRVHEMSDGETEARFDRVKPGTWVINALLRAAGSDGFLKVDEINLKSGETRHIDAELDPPVFSGRVTVGGSPVAAHVYLRDASGVGQHFDSLSDGTFHAVLPDPGVYTVDVARVEAQSILMRAGEVAFDDPARPVEIALPAPATVVVHVRTDSEPFPDALITASEIRSTSSGVEPRWLAHHADAQGNWTFENLMPGDWLFSVHDQNTNRAAHKEVSLDGSNTAEITLNLEASADISGRILDRNGIPVPDVQVDCLIPDP